ncbi:MAG: glycosyltransferase family 4 protein [Actinomycetota bacterium]
MRVGLVSPYDLRRVGGVQNQVLELRRLLTAAGTEVRLIGPGAEDLGGVGVGKVRTVTANRSVVPLVVEPGAWGRVRKSLEEVDLVHVHEPLMPLVGLAALSAAPATVATFHAQPPRWVELFYRTLPRRLMRGVGLTAVSPLAAGAASRFGPITLIPNGIDTSFFRTGVQRHPGRVVFVGRDEPRKGRAILLAAWKLQRGRDPDAELVVIGPEGPAARGVTYAGAVTDEEKSRLLQSASILVAPNLGGESFGLVVLEAMASGCAVIASDLAAFRWVTAGTALLCPPGRPDVLAALLADLLRNPAEIAQIGRRGRARAVTFDWAAVIPQYVAAYRRVSGMSAPR